MLKKKEGMKSPRNKIDKIEKYHKAWSLQQSLYEMQI
jgi:hypothetical protein